MAIPSQDEIEGTLLHILEIRAPKALHEWEALMEVADWCGMDDTDLYSGITTPGPLFEPMMKQAHDDLLKAGRIEDTPEGFWRFTR